MIELKPQLPILDEGQLANFISQQRTRRETITTTHLEANKRIEARRKAVTIPKFGEPRRVGAANVRVLSAQDQLDQKSARSHAERNALEDIRSIRESADEVVRPLLKAMFAARDQATEMKERTYDKLSILRRARGPFTGEGSFQRAMDARASYRTILRDIEPMELAKWAQQCLDMADPMSLIIADAILRENFTRSRDQRSFLNAAFLDKLQVPGFEAAQTGLQEVILLAKTADVEHKSFMAVPAGHLKIGLGLELDELGGVLSALGEE